MKIKNWLFDDFIYFEESPEDKITQLAKNYNYRRDNFLMEKWTKIHKITVKKLPKSFQNTEKEYNFNFLYVY